MTTTHTSRKQSDDDVKPNGAAPIFDNLSDHQEPEAPPSVFSNLAEHVLDLEDGEDAAEELLTTVPIRRPSKKDFIRCHPTHRFMAKIYEEPLSSEIHYVHPRIRSILTEEEGAKTVYLVLYMTRRKTLCFWPITTTTMGAWHSTAMTAVELAETHWVKVLSDKTISGYRVRRAKADYGEPDWGDHTLEELLELAFRGRVLDNSEHKVVRDALGEPL